MEFEAGGGGGVFAGIGGGGIGEDGVAEAAPAGGLVAEFVDDEGGLVVACQVSGWPSVRRQMVR